jgi:hypothetical protein
MLDPPARGDSIMLSSGMSPSIERGTYLNSHTGQFSPGVERPGYIVPSDSDEVRRIVRLDSSWGRYVMCVH